MTEEEILSARETFAKSAKYYQGNRSSEANSFGGFILKDGSYLEVGKWVCHGWLSEHNLKYYVKEREKTRKGISYVLSAVMYPWVSEDKLLRYIDWLINRSPWEKIFVDKDAKNVLKLGYLIDTDFCSSFIGSAMVASRFMTESYSSSSWVWRCEVYQELLDIGCTENEAFFFAHMYNKESAKSLYPITFSRLSSGHSTFYSYGYQEDYVRNFLNGTPVNFGTNKLCEGNGYESGTLNKTWGNVNKSDAFATKVLNITPIKKQVKNDLHIFRKLPTRSYTYLDREDFSSAIQQLKGMLCA